jgi:hypothetical protein
VTAQTWKRHAEFYREIFACVEEQQAAGK